MTIPSAPSMLKAQGHGLPVSSPCRPTNPAGIHEDSCVVALLDLLNIGDHQRTTSASIRHLDQSSRASALSQLAPLRSLYASQWCLVLPKIPHGRSWCTSCCTSAFALWRPPPLHDAPTAGYLGATPTYDHMHRCFYWPSLYVMAFGRYQCRTTPHSLPASPLQPTDVPPEPFFRTT